MNEPMQNRTRNNTGNHGSGCRQLMQNLRMTEFAMIDTILYLDAYPDSQEALDYYHKLHARRDALTEEYETNCGPLSAFGNRSKTTWDWTDEPFPWEYDAN